MTIVNDLTPTQYKPIRLVIEIAPDEVLTVDSISAHSDIRILNADGRELGMDHPEPQVTAQQLAVFLEWVQNNLSTYEMMTGLMRYVRG